MPELPEVETTVNGLRPILQGARLASVDVRRPDLRRAFPADLRQRMTGAVITGLSRRAKYGVIETDRGDAMIFHLGMSGRWRIEPDSIGTHDHLVIETDGGARLALNDPRRFGSVDLVAGDPATTFAPFAALGPEPLSAAFDALHLKSVFTGRKTAIKLALLDQRMVAGLGNIYVCEALHIAGISPFRAAGDITTRQLRILVLSIKSVLESAIAAGGSTLRDFRSPTGELGYFAKDWQVYGRAGDVCACGKPVLREIQGGRSTFFCACQQ